MDECVFLNVVTEALDNCGCCQLTKDRLKEPGTKPGAVWHIFDPEDADKIRELLNKVRGKYICIEFSYLVMNKTV